MSQKLWYTSVLASWNDFHSRRITPEIFFLLQVYKQIKPVSELAVSKLSTILNDLFENNSPVNVTDVLLELSKVLMVSESAVTPKFKANRAMTGGNKTREPCKTCGRIHGGECWDLQTCGKCGETGHPDHRHDAVMRQRGEQDKAKQHAERKGRKATTKKAVDSDDSSSDTDVGSELAALSASFADAVTRVGKRASAKTMKGLRASATPVGDTANKSPADGLEWVIPLVNDPGIWIFLGSGICTAGIISQFDDVRITPAKVICIELNAQLKHARWRTTRIPRRTRSLGWSLNSMT